MTLYFLNFHVVRAAFGLSHSILDQFNFEKWTNLEHFFRHLGRDDSPVYFILCGVTYLNFIYSRLAEFGHNQSLLWGVNQQELAISALPAR